MTASIHAQLGALGANVRNAKYSKAEIARMTEPGRVAAATAREQRIIATYNLDPSAPDFSYRLREGIRAHYRALRLSRARKAAAK